MLPRVEQLSQLLGTKYHRNDSQAYPASKRQGGISWIRSISWIRRAETVETTVLHFAARPSELMLTLAASATWQAYWLLSPKCIDLFDHLFSQLDMHRLRRFNDLFGPLGAKQCHV